MNSHAFIFDMDGVLIDSNPYHKIALNQFCAKHGHHLTDEQLLNKVYGRTNKEWLTNLFGPLPEATVHAYAEEKEAFYRQLFEHDIKPVKGLLPFLDLLDKYNIARAIGTSAPQSNVAFTLSKTHTEKYFSTILKDSDIEHSKPNPEIYIKAAERLGFPSANCIVFEDSLSGVKAGKASGAKVVGITTTHTKEELFETDFVIDDFVGLDPLVLIKELFS
jgi:HAD superfamily hydrolase (TIGR01509 family)